MVTVGEGHTQGERIITFEKARVSGGGGWQMNNIQEHMNMK